MRRQALLAALAVALSVRAMATDHLEAGPHDGRIVVNAFKAGLFSGFAHDHHFTAGDWRATADVSGDPAAARIEVVVDAGSLRDVQPSLSEADRRKVDAQVAGPDVLDASRHPRVEFRAERIELTPSGPAGPVRGTAHGTLTARGRAIPLDVPFEAERSGPGWRVRGTARLKQSALGIKPFSGFGGTVKVKDEITVEFALSLAPPGR